MLELQLDPSVEAELEEQARVRNQTIEEYARYLVVSSLPGKPKGSPQERAKAWLESAASRRVTAPPLSDEAISRESIYG